MYGNAGFTYMIILHELMREQNLYDVPESECTQIDADNVNVWSTLNEFNFFPFNFDLWSIGIMKLTVIFISTS